MEITIYNDGDGVGSGLVVLNWLYWFYCSHYFKAPSIKLFLNISINQMITVYFNKFNIFGI